MKTKAERNHHQGTCTIRNVKWSSSQWRKKMPDRNPNLHEGMKKGRNGKCMCRYKIFPFPEFFKEMVNIWVDIKYSHTLISFKNNWLLKEYKFEKKK